MKRFLLIALLILATASAVSIEGFVNDEAGIIEPAAESELSSLLESLQKAGAAEYAIVTVNSLEGRDIESFSYNLAEGVLGDKEKNNGLLLVVAVEDRKYRFEVGRGLEPVLPDIVMGRIGRDYLVPYFREQNYEQGILEASKAISARLQNETDSSYFVSDTPQVEVQPWMVILAILMFIVIISALFNAFAGKGGHSGEDYFFAAWAASQMTRGGGFGGGFGGFGGGGFGGGGASGGW